MGSRAQICCRETLILVLPPYIPTLEADSMAPSSHPSPPMELFQSPQEGSSSWEGACCNHRITYI